MLLPPDYTIDGLHLTVAGYRAGLEVLRPGFASLKTDFNDVCPVIVAICSQERVLLAAPSAIRSSLDNCRAPLGAGLFVCRG